MSTLTAGLVAVWNLLPKAVGLVNEVVHVAHDTIHAIAQALTITIR